MQSIDSGRQQDNRGEYLAFEDDIIVNWPSISYRKKIKEEVFTLTD